PEPSRARVDPALTPPLRLAAGALSAPHDAHGMPLNGSVLLDVQVRERGNVTPVSRAGGSNDSALVRAPTATVRGMPFPPARRGEEPVAVGCRQRFDFGAAVRR